MVSSLCFTKNISSMHIWQIKIWEVIYLMMKNSTKLQYLTDFLQKNNNV